MARMFHVSSVLNRESILAHGLDWTRMGAAPGIAGSQAPEADGVFLCQDEDEAAFFLHMNNTGGPVDLWAVTDVDAEQLIDNGCEYSYLPAKILPAWVTLVSQPDERPVAAPGRRDRASQRRPRKQQRK